MKRIVCLLLVVSIAYAGCVDTKPKQFTVEESIVGWSPTLERFSKLKEKIEKLERELSEAKAMPKKDEALLDRITELEAAIESQRAELTANITKLKKELSEAKAMPKQYQALLVRLTEIEGALGYQRAVERAEKALLVRINDLEVAIESQRAVEREEKDLLFRIYELEVAIESQRAEIENSQKISRLYEVAIESQKVAIESLEKLCRMYEVEIESQGKSRSSEESPLREEPETHQTELVPDPFSLSPRSPVFF